MSLYDPNTALLQFNDDRFGTLNPKWSPFIMMGLAVLELLLVMWIHDGSSNLPVPSLPAFAFTLINSGVLVYVIHSLRLKRRANYRAYLSSVPVELITLSAQKMDAVTRKEIADWQDNQKVTL